MESIESSILFGGMGEKEGLKLGHLKVCGSGAGKNEPVFQRRCLYFRAYKVGFQLFVWLCASMNFKEIWYGGNGIGRNPL